MLATADDWQRIGVGVDQVTIPTQRAPDREYRATMPGFDLVRQPFEPERVVSSEAALPENKFNGKNRTRYMNPVMDGYVHDYLTTIPIADRVRALGQIVHLMSEDVVGLGVFYAPEPKLIANRLVNVHAAKNSGADETWNGNEWDVR